jgi:hypothetical protein
MRECSVGVEEGLLAVLFIVSGDGDFLVVEGRAGGDGMGEFVGVLIANDADELEFVFGLGLEGIDDLSSLLIEAGVS